MVGLFKHFNLSLHRNKEYKSVNKLSIFFVILIATLCLPSHAQISFGGLPCSSSPTRSLEDGTIPCISVFPDTTEEIETNQFAFPINTDIDITKKATSSISGDKIIYRLLVHSENAKSINLIFNPIYLPTDAKMFLSRPDGGEIYGAYTKSSFSGDVFATTPVSGDSIMIQCEVPVANSDSFSATISSVNIGFDGLRLLPDIGESSYCETDAVCENNGMENQRRSACLIIINGIKYCSGALVATESNDSEAFVLSAAHCLHNYYNEFDSTLAKKCVFYFGVNSPICESSIIGSYEKSISGSQVASSHADKDMLLLKLSQRPPVDYMTYESGWNIELAPYGPVACLHHPSGDQMKISISEDDPSPYSYDKAGLAPNSHWLISEWSVGVTENGSSGAPLYDSNGLIIGALSGGTSICTYRGNDKFWRLNSVWDDHTSEPTDIMSVLDPNLSGIIRRKGKESYERRCYQLKNYDSASELDEPHSADYGYASGKNTFGLEEFAEKFTSPYSSTEIHGISFIPILGTYDKNKPVFLRIYSSDEGADNLVPDNLVYESVVKITTREFFTNAGAVGTSTISNLSYKENYMRLDSAVTVGKTFFVSFYTDYENVDFALLTSKSDTKTAYFKKNGIWDSWENHPFDNTTGSLLINAIIRDSNADGIKDIDVDGNITVYPNPTKDIIHFECADGIKEVKIYNALGKLEIKHRVEANYKQNGIEMEVKNLPKGVYSVEITTAKGNYHTKFIKE